MRFVVDTSVVLKWVVAEQDSQHAQTLVGLPLVAPDLLRAELANALWNKVVIRNELTPEQASRGLERASGALHLIPATPLADRALALGLALLHPIYDCFFLALAERLELPLITADRRFLNRVRASSLAIRVLHLEEWSRND